MSPKPIKPLGSKAYGSIPHLPGSRRGPADKGLSEDQARILTEKPRDMRDFVIVQEKLDGSSIAVAKINGEIVPLIRAGYRAEQSNWSQHHHFARWVKSQSTRFDRLLKERERVCGEWLMEAHGTRYNLSHEPFVAFDLMTGKNRRPMLEVIDRCEANGFTTPKILHMGRPFSVEAMLTVLEPSGHGALDPVEGAVWRVERNHEVDFLGKYVRPDKLDGKYLENVTGLAPIYNWTPPDEK
jgi:hypothetical protein